jgi:hypothetical protein
LCVTTSIKNAFIISKIVFPVSIEIDSIFTEANADPSINCTLRGITIDSSDDSENALDSIRVNLESDSNVIDESDLHFEKHDEQRSSTFRGRTIDSSDDFENALDSIRVNLESDSNVIDERDLQHEKHDEPRIAREQGIVISAELEKLRINLCVTKSIKKAFIISKIVFPVSIEIDSMFTEANADPSINRTLRGITIDLSDEDENAFDSIRVNLESDSNVINERE